MQNEFHKKSRGGVGKGGESKYLDRITDPPGGDPLFRRESFGGIKETAE